MPFSLNHDVYEQALTGYAMHSCDSRGRVHPEKEHEYRSIFQRDRDRIIHSTAFRRLEYKTQVFVNHEGDHYRTRLTHTLEVAQIARVLARSLFLNECLTEAIALAHDMGHTPFGHSGEMVLNKLMEDDKGFEHNAQGLRVVDVLEHRYPDFPGINLSFEVRLGFVTHSTRHDFPKENTEFAGISQPPLEAQIVSVADEIAYDNHDLDDGLSSGILHEEEVEQLRIWQKAVQEIGVDRNSVSQRMYWAMAIRKLIDLEVTDILCQTRKNIDELAPQTVGDIMNAKKPLIVPSDELAEMKLELEQFLSEKFYNYYTVRRMTNKAATLLTDMFNAYISDPRMLPVEHQESVDKFGVKRAVCDYIAGMTDRFAQQEYSRLFHPLERT